MKKFAVLIMFVAPFPISVPAQSSQEKPYEFYFIEPSLHPEAKLKWERITEKLQEKNHTENFTFYQRQLSAYDKIQKEIKYKRKYKVTVEDNTWGQDDKTFELIFTFKRYTSNKNADKEFNIYCVWTKDETESQVNNWISDFFNSLIVLTEGKEYPKKDIRMYEFETTNSYLAYNLPHDAYIKLAGNNSLNEKYNFYFYNISLTQKNNYIIIGDVDEDRKGNVATFEIVLPTTDETATTKDTTVRHSINFKKKDYEKKLKELIPKIKNALLPSDH